MDAIEGQAKDMESEAKTKCKLDTLGHWRVLLSSDTPNR